jgi:hypothetical protein
MSFDSPKARFKALVDSRGPESPIAPLLDLGGPFGSLPLSLHLEALGALSLPKPSSLEARDPFLARLGMIEPGEDLLERLGAETRWLSFNPPASVAEEAGGVLKMIDEWGAGYMKGPGEAAFKHVWAPLGKATGRGDLKNHRWPRLDGAFDDRWGRAAESAASRGRPALCVHLKGVLEVVQDLRGHAMAAAELSGGSAFLRSLADTVAEAQILAYGRLSEVLGKDLDAMAFSCDGLAAERGGPLFVSAPALFPSQARVLESLRPLGGAAFALYGRGEGFPAAASDLGADALIDAGGPEPGPRLLWWTGPARADRAAGGLACLSESDPEKAYRGAVAFAKSLSRSRLVLAPWLEAGGATGAGAAMTALALGRFGKAGG